MPQKYSTAKLQTQEIWRLWWSKFTALVSTFIIFTVQIWNQWAERCVADTLVGWGDQVDSWTKISSYCYWLQCIALQWASELKGGISVAKNTITDGDTHSKANMWIGRTRSCIESLERLAVLITHGRCWRSMICLRWQFSSLNPKKGHVLVFETFIGRSCFGMTEPAVASSDATNIQASIVRSEMSSCNNSASYHEQESSQLTRNLFDLVSNVHRDGDEYVLNGRKWWTSNGMDPRSGLKIVLYFNECVKLHFLLTLVQGVSIWANVC